MRLLLISNIAPHYRAAIYKKIDRELCADFVFGDKTLDIQPMDYSQLTHSVKIVHNVRFWHGYYQKGVLGGLFKDYDTYLMNGEFRNISLWVMLLYLWICPQKRAYLWTHGWLGKENKTKRFVTKLMFCLADGIFVYNDRSRKLMIDGGIPAQKMRTIYNSLDYEAQLVIRCKLREERVYQNYFGNDDKTLIFVGRLTWRKRLGMILHAMKLCEGQGHHYNLMLIGEGEAMSDLVLLAEELGLKKRVWFYGACYDEHVLGNLIFNADLCVSPGNIGLTAIHVLMFGCPAVTNNDLNHQMPEFEAIKEGQTGTLFHAGDVQSLAKAISGWFQSSHYNRELIRQACYHEVDSKWTPNNQLLILKELLSNSGSLNGVISN